MAWVEKDHNDHPVLTPCYVQSCQPLEWAAQSHIQPGLECLQGWGIHNLLVFQCVTTLCVKNFLLISNLNLPCPSLKPFSLVLSLSTLVNNHYPSCLYAPFKYWKATVKCFWTLLFSKLRISSIAENTKYFPHTSSIYWFSLRAWKKELLSYLLYLLICCFKCYFSNILVINT